MLVADALTEVLETVHLESTVFCRSELTAPWGIRIGEEHGAMFHIVADGQCWLKVDELLMPLLLKSGDFVVLPHGHGHILSDDPTSPIVPLETVMLIEPNYGYKTLCYGKGGTATNLVSGCFDFRGHPKNPLLAALPPLIHVKSESDRVLPWLENTLKFITCETTINLPGGQTVITRLADILFIQAVRAHLADLDNGQDGWLGALSDPDIGSALGLIHRHPEWRWTVASLAERVVMSRSAFASRFEQLVGQPPLQYLTTWRMHKATKLLRYDRTAIEEIAAQVGYGSEVAFSRAFKRWAGVSPGTYRRSN